MFVLQLSVYRYIFFIYSIFNFANALAFKSIDDTDLDCVQLNVRAILFETLKDFVVSDPRENAIFFGIYWKSPERFEFGRGDRKFIKELALHVKGKVENGDIEYFHRTENGNTWMKKLISTPIGLFFGSISKQHKLQTANQSSDSTLNDDNEAKTKTFEANLLQQIEKLNKPYALKGVVQKQETDVCVTVNGNGIKGSVVCCFCENGAKGSKVKIYYQKSASSGSWIKSNYINHLTNVHGEPKKRKGEPKIEPKHVTTNSNLDEANTSDVMVVSEEGTIDSDPFYKQCCDVLFGQISKQVISMTNTTLSNSEKILDFHVRMDMCKKATTRYVKICTIRGDGSCLFGSIAHQLFYHKLNSDDHNSWTKKLRKQVVDYIGKNYLQFKNYLRSRVYSNHPEEKDENKIEEACKHFLEKELPEHHIYGGIESIKAITEIYCVNILTVNEDGSCHMNMTFDKTYDKTIFISFRNNNHFDSVVDIDSATISQFTKSLAVAVFKKHNDKSILLV